MSTPTHFYKDLIVWQRSIELIIEIYRLTKQFPKEEKYGLASQMERAAVSTASNIAEGYNRQHLGEYVHFLSISFGSCAELDTQITVAQKLPHLLRLDYTRAIQLLGEVSKMLRSMIEKMDQKR